MHVLQAEPLQRYNTLALQGLARGLVHVAGQAQLLAALQWAQERKLPVIPLGQGSNVVIAGDLEALVLRMETRGIQVLEDAGERVLLRVEAGESWHGLVQWTLQQGFYGLENLALIPGTVGAAPIQNIGAYGVELAPFVREVHCLELATGKSRSLAASTCEFGYRDSVFKQALRDQLLITAVDIELSRLPNLQVEYPALARELAVQSPAVLSPQGVFDAVVSIRRSKLPDPSQVANAGSFFKNPVVTGDIASDLAREFPRLPQYPQDDERVKLPAAWLIDFCGWKGVRRGEMGIHPEHALVLVNYGGDSGTQLLELAAAVAASVLETFDIQLEIEPRIYGSQS